MPTRRNPVARAPILRKGGVHQRTRSGQRQCQREVLWDGLDEYLASKRSPKQTLAKRNKDVPPDGNYYTTSILTYFIH